MRILLLFLISNFIAAQAPSAANAAARLDAYLDDCWTPPADATKKLLAELGPSMTAEQLESMLRAGRSTYPPAPEPRSKILGPQPLPIDYVDHTTAYLVYVPKSYDPAKAAPLLVVGHGGSSGRDLAFGQQAARSGMEPWLASAESAGAIVFAPITDRGWNTIGNGILFSGIRKATQMFHIDSDRIYLTGHSMGGHLTWRSSFTFADRFAAVSPMSGGYDYVKDKQVYGCFNVPGYATWGMEEPYQINEFNRTIAEWLKAHGSNWINQEKSGGHEIFDDEIPKVMEFFTKHPRDLYRSKVFARFGAWLAFEGAEENPAWGKKHTWQPKRPLKFGTVHWLRLHNLRKETPADKAVQTVYGTCNGNTITLVAHHAPKATIYLHPKMVDFTKPVKVVVNGQTVHDKKLVPSLTTMFELAREFGDRGRVFWAQIQVDIKSNKDPGEPRW